MPTTGSANSNCLPSSAPLITISFSRSQRSMIWSVVAPRAHGEEPAHGEPRSFPFQASDSDRTLSSRLGLWLDALRSQLSSKAIRPRLLLVLLLPFLLALPGQLDVGGE